MTILIDRSRGQPPGKKRRVEAPFYGSRIVVGFEREISRSTALPVPENHGTARLRLSRAVVWAMGSITKNAPRNSFLQKNAMPLH